jgi:hypothetical protein
MERKFTDQEWGERVNCCDVPLKVQVTTDTLWQRDLLPEGLLHLFPNDIYERAANSTDESAYGLSHCSADIEQTAGKGWLRSLMQSR